MMSQRSADRVLDLHAVLERLNERGYNFTFRQVQRWASNRRLPVARGPDNKKLYVRETDLEKFIDAPPGRPRR